MAFRIFVGNLSYDVVDDDLRDAFSPFGDVVFSRVILDRETGKSRGFGFVELKDESAGQKALDALNGSQLKDRELRLKQAEPREDSGGPRSRDGGGYSGGPRTARPRPMDRDGGRDFGGGQPSEDSVRRRPAPKKPKERDSGDKFRAPHAQQGRPTAKTKGGSKNRLQGYGEEEEDDDDNIVSNYSDEDYEFDLSEVEGVEIEGVEIEGVDLSGISVSETDADEEQDADSSAAAEGLAEQLKRSLEKREEQDP